MHDVNKHTVIVGPINTELAETVLVALGKLLEVSILVTGRL